jgi:hypothetical protein
MDASLLLSQDPRSCAAWPWVGNSLREGAGYRTLQDVVELLLELVWAAWPLNFFSRENWRFVEAALIR